MCVPHYSVWPWFGRELVIPQRPFQTLETIEKNEVSWPVTYAVDFQLEAAESQKYREEPALPCLSTHLSHRSFLWTPMSQHQKLAL